MFIYFRIFLLALDHNKASLEWQESCPQEEQAKYEIEGGLDAWEAGSNGSGSQDPEENE